MLKLNSKYKVNTPNGYGEFDGIQKTEKGEYLNIMLGTSRTIRCSLEHPFIINEKKIKAQDLTIGAYLHGETGVDVEITSIEHIKNKIVLYDLINVHEDHQFYVNGILSSNCDASFLSSGNSVIDAAILKQMEINFVIPPIEKRYNERLWIWKYADPNKSYIVAADVARGDGGDYSAFHILDVDSMEQVAEFKGKAPTDSFGSMLVNIANEYNQALLVIENASIGWAVLQVAIDRGYPNLYYTNKDFKYIDIQTQLKKSYDIVDKDKVVAGFTTSSRTRPLIIEKLERICADKSDPVIIRSKRLIDEMYVFIWNKQGKAIAQSGYNDDLVMSYSIALWVRDTAIKLRREGIKLTKEMLKRVTKTTFAGGKSNANENNAWDLEVGASDNFNLRELL